MNSHNNIIMQFHGMKQKETPTHLKDYLESLLRHAPSNATCHLHIFKEPRGYLCKLTVHSNIKTFSAHFKGETTKLALKTVLKDVKKQIAYWKKNRSTMELTGVTSINHLNLSDLDSVEAEAQEPEEYYKKVA